MHTNLTQICGRYVSAILHRIKWRGEPPHSQSEINAIPVPSFYDMQAISQPPEACILINGRCEKAGCEKPTVMRLKVQGNWGRWGGGYKQLCDRGIDGGSDFSTMDSRLTCVQLADPLWEFPHAWMHSGAAGFQWFSGGILIISVHCILHNSLNSTVQRSFTVLVTMINVVMSFWMKWE